MTSRGSTPSVVAAAMTTTSNEATSSVEGTKASSSSKSSMTAESALHSFKLGSDIPEDEAQELDPDAILDNLNFDNLDITAVDISFDEVGAHIQENLEHEFVKVALEQGVDLRQYARKTEKDLFEVEQASVEDYISQSENIALLHNQIYACDKILENMEKFLGTFQSDLGSISTEIQSLQEQSLSMNVKLKNRKDVESKLHDFVSQAVVPNELIVNICEREVNEAYLNSLLELDQKITFYSKQNKEHKQQVIALQETAPELEKLRIKATTKLRDFLMQRLGGLRKPMANYQVIQNTLIKFKHFNQFLMQHHRPTAAEVRNEYIETMGKIYYSLFKQYLGNILKLQYEEVADKDDLLGTEDNAKKGFFGAKLSLKAKPNIFTLGQRGNVLKELEAPAIVPSVAKQQNQQFPYEAIFRCFHFALIDNATSEYMFMSDFFDVRGIDANDIFNGIFGKPALVYMKHLETYLPTCFDAIGLLICICINTNYQLLMAKRNIPCFDQYFERIQQMLMPRLKFILEANVESIHLAHPKKLGSVDTGPHYVTRRYAEFASAIVSLNEDFHDDQIAGIMTRMRVEMENLIAKMAQEFKSTKEQLIFLINNYDMILGVMSERTTNSKETEYFQQLLNARTQEFVEETLMPSFGGMIAFVKEVEPLLETAPAKVTVDNVRIERIVRTFSAEYKRAIEALNSDVVVSFPNFKNGTAILQAVLTQLIVYYQRFHNALGKPPFKNLPIRNELVNIHYVMVEIKKHRAAF